MQNLHKGPDKMKCLLRFNSSKKCWHEPLKFAHGTYSFCIYTDLWQRGVKYINNFKKYFILCGGINIFSISQTGVRKKDIGTRVSQPTVDILNKSEMISKKDKTHLKGIFVWFPPLHKLIFSVVCWKSQ